MNRLELSYITPQRGREYLFLQVPLLLFQHSLLKNISPAAKMAYSFLLRRVGLSAKNPIKYTDEQGHLYIIYPRENLARDMQVNADSVTKYLKQLEKIGLIKQKRRGQGKPSLIYVMDFTSIALEMSEGCTEQPETPVNSEQNALGEERAVSETEDVGFKKPKMSVSRNRDVPPQETEMFGAIEKDLREKDLKEPSFLPSGFQKDELLPEQQSLGLMDGEIFMSSPAYEEIEVQVKDQIDYVVLIDNYTEEEADSMVRLIADTLCRPPNGVSLNGGNISGEMIQRRFWKLSYEDVAFVLDKLHETKRSEVRNPRAYTLALLYNAIPALSG